MGGFSFVHLLFVLIIILVFFGPSRLPSLGKSMGEAIRGFKKGLEGDEIDVTNQRREQLNAQAPSQPTQAQPTETVATPPKDPTGGQQG